MYCRSTILSKMFDMHYAVYLVCVMLFSYIFFINKFKKQFFFSKRPYTVGLIGPTLITLTAGSLLKQVDPAWEKMGF